jgi:hypothetical protein
VLQISEDLLVEQGFSADIASLAKLDSDDVAPQLSAVAYQASN